MVCRLWASAAASGAGAAAGAGEALRARGSRSCSTSGAVSIATGSRRLARPAMSLRPHPAVAQLPDQVLRRVSQVVHRPQPDHGRRALDGVQVAKDIAQKLRILGPSLDVDELDGQRLEPLVHLGKEELDHVVVDCGRPRDLRRRAPRGRLPPRT
jgi:hypothetical protein